MENSYLLSAFLLSTHCFSRKVIMVQESARDLKFEKN
jgi:hypothetical protein